MLIFLWTAPLGHIGFLKLSFCLRRLTTVIVSLGFASPVLGIGSGQPDGESTAVYLKGQAAALVIVRQGGNGRDILPHTPSIDFQVGVVSTDGDSAADFVKPYLGQLVFLLDSCNHFEFHLISDRICKGLFFAGKSPFKTGRIHRFSNGNAADDAEAVQRFCKRNSAKICGLDRKTAFLTNRRKHGCKTELFLEKIADCLPFSPNIVFLCLPGISPQRRSARSHRGGRGRVISHSDGHSVFNLLLNR